MRPRHPTPTACFASIRAPELYRNFAIHLFVMFPAAMGMCALASGIDHTLGIEPLGTATLRIGLGGSLIAVGGLWVWYVYGFLFLAGHGSPGTHVDGGPTTMVDTGPYTAMRHPSVQGKVLGVIGLGVAWGSTTFLVGFLPVLILYSVITNRLLQERFCEQRFGGRYDEYRRRVPMLVPRPSGLRRWMRGEPALSDEPSTSASQPPGVSTELPWYLVGLVALITVFALVRWLI